MAISVTEAIKPTTDVLQTYDINPTDVLAEDNITQTVTAPAVAPDDLLGIRNQIYAEKGITEAQQAYLDAQKATRDFKSQYDTEQQELSNRPVSMSKIVGTQRQHALTRQGDYANLQTAEDLAIQAYQMKKALADEEFAFREAEIAEKKQLMAQAPEAGIKWSDSYETAIKKIAKWDREEQERIKKEAYKDSLKAQLMAMGSSTKGLSTNELEKKLKKKNKAALEAAEAQANLEFQMKLEKHNADMQNINSLIANRGGSSIDEQEAASWAAVVSANPSMLSSVPAQYKSVVTQIVDPNIFKQEDTRYSSKELGQLRAYGIDPTDTSNADQFLYGDGLTPEERLQEEQKKWWQFWK